jgi:putative aminopeptidase FrvX
MQMLGGWLDQALVDQRWIIIGSKGPVRAITGIRDIHIVPQEERTKVYPRESIFLDVGAKTAAEAAAMGLEPGDPVVPDAPFAVMNGTQNYLGKGWDDRVGCAVVIEAMKKLAHAPHPNQIFWVATVQEEIGVRGAHTSSDLVKPEIGIAIEGGVTRDAPGVHPEEAQELLGGGPAIFLYDSSALPNLKLVSLVKQTAKEKSIPLQSDLIQGYGDDSSEMQKSNGGAPTVNMVVPVRYTHSHNGIMNRGDFDKMVDLPGGGAAKTGRKDCGKSARFYATVKEENWPRINAKEHESDTCRSARTQQRPCSVARSILPDLFEAKNNLFTLLPIARL